MSSKKKNGKIAGLIIALVVVLAGGVLFVGAVAGWFDGKVELSAEYYCGENCGDSLTELDAEKYEELARGKKSFVVMIDQGGCQTAERVRGYALEFEKQIGIEIYAMMFSTMKETNLHEKVKYYPSVAVVDQGKVRTFLRADSEEDTEKYNDYEAFKSWLSDWVVEK